MLLAADIGNTNIVIGGIEADAIVFEARIATDRTKTADQYAVLIKNILSLYHVDPEQICDCMISSVVPPVLNAVSAAILKTTGHQPIVVGPGIKTGLNIKLENPAAVGSDRIVATVGALAQFKPPLILIDLGTATTFEVVDRDYNYIGGCILPGVRTSMEALISHSAQLPGISLAQPQRLIGKNTVECMRSGVLYGAACLIDGMLENLEQELGEKATVIATGGMAQFIVPLCRRSIGLENDLILKGLQVIYQRNLRRKKA